MLYLLFLLQDSCPSRFVENGINFFERDNFREEYCYDRNKTCCITGWYKDCNGGCAEKKCTEMGGRWIRQNYEKKPYTCQMGNFLESYSNSYNYQL